MAEHPPDFWGNLRGESVAGRHWIDRAIVAALNDDKLSAAQLSRWVSHVAMVLSLMATALLARRTLAW